MQWHKRVTRNVWRWPVKLATVLFFCIIVLICAKPLLVAAGRYLSMPSSDQHCDALILPSGATVSNYFMNEAIGCYRTGQVDHIIIVMHEYDLPSSVFGLDHYDELLMQEIHRRGIADSVVIPLYLKVSDPYTLNTARALVQPLQRRGIQSILLLQDNFHIRRSVLTFRKVLEPWDIQVYPRVLNIYLDESNWYRSANGWRRVIDEYIKLIFYRINGYLE